MYKKSISFRYPYFYCFFLDFNIFRSKTYHITDICNVFDRGRSKDECVVALCDQWYLDYGDKDWKADVKVGKSKGFQLH